MRFLPCMNLVCLQHSGNKHVPNVARLMATVSFLRGKQREADRWLVKHYPDGEFLSPHQDDQRHSLVETIPQGETRYPRDTAKAAVYHVAELTSEAIPALDRTSLAKVAEMLIPLLERATKAHGVQFGAR